MYIILQLPGTALEMGLPLGLTLILLCLILSICGIALVRVRCREKRKLVPERQPILQDSERAEIEPVLQVGESHAQITAGVCI